MLKFSAICFLKQPEGDIIPIEFSMIQIVWLVLLVAPTIIFGLYFSPIVAYAQESVKLFSIVHHKH